MINTSNNFHSINPHKLEDSEFQNEVHSFEFWFHSVEGYLSNTDYGVSLDAQEEKIDEDRKEALITILCNYCIGETAALEASSGMIRYAPNRNSKIFLSTQVVDEGRHLEVLLNRLKTLGVDNAETEITKRATPSIQKFKTHLLEYVDKNDWEAAVFVQNVVLESMEFSVFSHHANTTDPITREILLGIIKDERRHMGFGENNLGRLLKKSTTLMPRLRNIQQELNPLVLEVFNETMGKIGADHSQQKNIHNNYLDVVSRLGIC